MSGFFALWLILRLVSGVIAGLHQSFTRDVLDTAFDYIVVGAGAAGAVLANRLSEDPHVNVLLIEAGSSDFEDINIEIPYLAFNLGHTKFDWNFTTTAQAGFNNRSIDYARGHVLGGSTAINLMDFCRGSRDDYNRWANITGDDGWSWDALFPYMLKIDRLTTPADGHNPEKQFNSSLHGDDGMLNTSIAGFSLPTDIRAINASSQLSDQFPFNRDYNSGDTIGLSWIQSTVYRGARMTSAQAYILPALSRSNLHVVVNSQVTKLVNTGRQNGLPAFRGVEIWQSISNTMVSMNASLELILSAGAVKTPHLLLLSGIGDAAELDSVGISCLVDLPDVGQNLQDHVFLPLSWTTKTNGTLDQISENTTFAAQVTQQWSTSRTGPLVLNAASQFGWFRLAEDSSIFATAADPSAGPTSAHYELIVTDSFISALPSPPPMGGVFTLVTNLISPSSRGSISLASPDPLEQPIINPNFLSAEPDIAVLREAVKAARAFAAAPAWSDWVEAETSSFAEAVTDQEIELFARDNSATVNHVVGTVAMGRQDYIKPGYGALNPDLTVKGTAGLRVVDASAFPFIISGHTQGPTYILAERASDLIKSKRASAV